MKHLIILLLLFMTIPKSAYASDYIGGRSFLDNYSDIGTEHGCAVVRNKVKFNNALRMYGWNLEYHQQPNPHWDEEMAVIINGKNMQYLGVELNNNNTAFVKWKEKVVNSGPTILPGGVTIWGSSDPPEQTMVVLLPRRNFKNKKVLCKQE